MEKSFDTLPILRTVAELRTAVQGWRSQGEGIGLVPTMGSLHAGHMALVERAGAENQRVVVTLFVNPKQFDRPDDLESYPRGEAKDVAMLAEADVDLLFAPTVEEMYPDGFATKVTVESLTDCLCGAYRPGHFDGVATVVSKLLLQCLPDHAYFGEKDYQQLLVIRRMSSDLDIPVEIRGVPTFREPDGLALSSRNRALTPEHRVLAPRLHEELVRAARLLADGAEASEILAEGKARLLESGFDDLDYFDLRHAQTLQALSRADPPCRVFAAAWLGSTRLIDNLPVG